MVGSPKGTILHEIVQAESYVDGRSSHRAQLISSVRGSYCLAGSHTTVTTVSYFSKTCLFGTRFQ